MHAALLVLVQESLDRARLAQRIQQLGSVSQQATNRLCQHKSVAEIMRASPHLELGVAQLDEDDGNSMFGQMLGA